jgi:lipoyl(octanoyl) transferase
VHLLEQTTIHQLGAWGIRGVRTENPGVWEESGEKKIAALGVHLRRNISSYGVGLNVRTDLRWFERIVACGLVGKGVTSMEVLGAETESKRTKPRGLQGKKIAKYWAKGFANGLYGEDKGEKVEEFKLEELGFEDQDLERILKLKEDMTSNEIVAEAGNTSTVGE